MSIWKWDFRRNKETKEWERVAGSPFHFTPGIDPETDRSSEPERIAVLILSFNRDGPCGLAAPSAVVLARGYLKAEREIRRLKRELNRSRRRL